MIYIESQVEGMLKSSLQNIREMIDVDTIVGKPIGVYDGVIAIPISKVKMGFASGGSDFKGVAKTDSPFGGATGGSVSISPIAFLVIKNNEARILHLQSDTHLYEKIIDLFDEKPNNEQIV